MSKMLVLNAHPNSYSTSSVSLKVLDRFLKSYAELNSDNSVELLNLYDENIPAVDRIVLKAWEKQAKGEPYTSEEQRVMDRMSEILQQFIGAKKLVIVMPLHNFNIPSKLKDYMDNIIIPRKTYRFTEKGSVGMLNDGRSVLVIQGSGSIYTNNNWYTDVEFSHKYLKSMFEFLGFDEYRIIRAEGTALLNEEDILAKAYKEAEEAALRMA
ncbi:FMN-dependent NADH-azoreductase [Paenibacillus allorhizosphaerae]|uniref:FMN dependent NADH:quinone oxidoreductase n=1 Tax=Paenibacillus allorhizosphaerae TaxID=2849866 RepID=A0ABN7TNT5_9BACL|nr:NAD(P)H-dependent oxidoreductase [Paenibacillus allorhizosphaerae]CAG7643936.1 FMN-dependent NADH-azoreductase 1 [Paenibacillus allorhizosphaerae]